MSNLLSQLRVAVIGGGISGVATAASLLKLGAKRVTVYDKLASISALHSRHPTGLVVSANGVRVLDALSLSPSVLSASHRIQRITQRTTRSDLLSSFSPSSVVRTRSSTGAPITSIASSFSQLHKAIAASLPQHALQWGAEVTAVERGERGYKLSVAGGSAGDETMADLIVGADGLDSTTRDGYVLQRAVSPLPLHGLLVEGVTSPSADSDQAPEELLEVWGNGQRFGSVLIGDGRVYWYATVAETYREQSGSPMDFAATFSAFPKHIAALISSTPPSSFTKSTLVHLPPVSPLYRDGVVLVGEAACLMPPDFHQQTAQSLESALTLALSLRASTSLPVALQRFSRIRHARLTAMHSAAVSECESAVRVGRLMSSLRDMASSMMPKQVSNAVYEQAVGYNVLAEFPELNSGGGLSAAAAMAGAGSGAAGGQQGSADEEDEDDEDELDELLKEVEELEEDQKKDKDSKRSK